MLVADMCSPRAYGAEGVAHLSSLLLFDAQPRLALSVDERVLTCGNAPTLEFTLIVQRAREIRLKLLPQAPDRCPFTEVKAGHAGVG